MREKIKTKREKLQRKRKFNSVREKQQLKNGETEKEGKEITKL